MKLAFAIAVAAILKAGAAYAGGYAGYYYPLGTICSPFCDGIRVTFIEPQPAYVGTNAETADGAFIWAGLLGNGTHGSGCSNPLMQIGTMPRVARDGSTLHYTFREEYGCNAVTSSSTLAINAGDTITIDVHCISDCTYGNSAASYSRTWTNVTTGQSINSTYSGYTVWGDTAEIEVEPWSTATDSASLQAITFAPIKFLKAEVHKNGEDWIPVVPGNGRRQGWIKQKSSPSTITKYSASAPAVDSDGLVTFRVCSESLQTTSTAASPCPHSPYIGSAGFGP